MEDLFKVMKMIDDGLCNNIKEIEEPAAFMALISTLIDVWCESHGISEEESIKFGEHLIATRKEIIKDVGFGFLRQKGDEEC